LNIVQALNKVKTDILNFVTRNLQNKVDIEDLDGYMKKCIVVTDVNTNLDNYTEEGLYYFGSSYTPINIPIGVNGWLRVMSASASVKQIWYRYGMESDNNYHTFVRTYAPSKGWSNWNKYITTHNTNGDVSMNGANITNLGNPTSGTDAANVTYVKSVCAPKNFLDNSNFNHIVNQKKAQGYSGIGYGFDRWYSYHSNSTLDTTTYTDPDTNMKCGCLRLYGAQNSNCIYGQKIDQFKSRYMCGKTFTFAVCKLDGDIIVCSGVCSAANVTSDTIQFSATGSDALHSIEVLKNGTTQNFEVRINVKESDSVFLKWAALYEGEYTVETLPTYHPKGYAAELLECQRYYYYGDMNTFLTGYKSDTAYVYFNLPVQMRELPVASADVINVRGSKDSDGVNTVATGIETLNMFGNTLSFKINGDGKENNQIITARVQNLELDSNL
jgi:hypothetical protein